MPPFVKIYKLIPIFAFVLLVPQGAQGAKLFSDVPPSHPYFEAVSELESRGILNGYPDGSFQPDESVSRAAALKVTLLAGGVEVAAAVSGKPFPDVPLSAWYAPVIAKGAELKVVKGDGAGNFVPERTVSRAEALAMLFRIQGVSPVDPTAAPFADVPLSAWYAGYFATAKDRVLISGNKADPEHRLSRAELSDLAYRFFKHRWQSGELTGQATYYGNGAEGSNTASGEAFSNADFVAAHRTLPFGSRVRVTNTTNFKSVVVKIIDRGPHGEGRVIDLSQAAFSKLAPLEQGVMPVTLEPVAETTPLGLGESCPPVATSKEVIAVDAFSGIRLSEPLPRRFRQNEVYLLRGTVTAAAADNKVTAFYGNDGASWPARAEAAGGRFELQLFFPRTGQFDLGVMPGSSGKAPVQKIEVIAPDCEPVFAEDAAAPQNLRSTVENGQAVFVWEGGDSDLFRLEFSQYDQQAVLYVRGHSRIVPPPAALAGLAEGKAAVKVWGARAAGDALARTSNWTAGTGQNIYATWHISRGDNKITAKLTPTFAVGEKVSLSGTTDRPLKGHIVVMAPGDRFFEVPLARSGNNFSAAFTPESAGIHLVEILQDDALALFVGATYAQGALPLLPDYFDLQEADGGLIETVASTGRPQAMLALVNAERQKRGLNPLLLDAALGRLADFRAQDMCDRDYFGHVDPDGKDAADYRVAFGVETGVGENIARHEDVRGAHEGLMHSPIHRKLIVNADNSRVGFGFCESKEAGGTALTVVQLYGGEPFAAAKIPEYRESVLGEVNRVRTQKPILPNTTLHSVAQRWAELMAEHDFWGFSYGSESLEKMLRGAGVNNHARSFVFKVGSVSELSGAFGVDPVPIGSGDQQNFLLDAGYIKMGAGFAVNDTRDVFLVIVAIK